MVLRCLNDNADDNKRMIGLIPTMSHVFGGTRPQGGGRSMMLTGIMAHDVP